MLTLFRDRTEAGKRLAAELADYAGRNDVVVLALPRGGVPVAYEVAKTLNAPLDVFLVRKLGVPGASELAMGAIASGGASVLDQELVARLGLPAKFIRALVKRETAELERRENLYRGGRGPYQVSGKVVILVDDGLATGSSMRAAVKALRRLHPGRIVVAIPVAPPSACEQLRTEVDELVCLSQPEWFRAVGEWYENFQQLTDGQVEELLAHAASWSCAA